MALSSPELTPRTHFFLCLELWTGSMKKDIQQFSNVPYMIALYWISFRFFFIAIASYVALDIEKYVEPITQLTQVHSVNWP